MLTTPQVFFCPCSQHICQCLTNIHILIFICGYQSKYSYSYFYSHFFVNPDLILFKFSLFLSSQIYLYSYLSQTWTLNILVSQQMFNQKTTISYYGKYTFFFFFYFYSFYIQYWPMGRLSEKYKNKLKVFNPCFGLATSAC